MNKKVYAAADTSWGQLEMLGIFQTLEQAKEIVADQIKWRRRDQKQHKLDQLNKSPLRPIQFNNGDSIQIFEEEVQ